MIDIRTFSLAASVAAVTLISPAQAATVDVHLVLDTVYTSATGVRSNSATYGTDLLGMTVGATYADGGSETFTWVQTNPNNAFATGLSPSSSDLGLTYGGNAFNLDADRRIESMTVNLLGANVIFDAGGYANSDPRNSPTTKVGIEFDIISGILGLPGYVAATYYDHVQIGSHLTGEDAFASLFIDFSNLEFGGFLGALTWRSDLDVLAANGPLVPVSPIPLPAGFSLLLAALAGLGFARRRSMAGPSAA